MNKLITQLAEMLNFVNAIKFITSNYAKDSSNTPVSTSIRL